jgi:hypothetical protein
MHTSATTRRSAIVLGFFMAISSIVLMSQVADPVVEGIDDLDVLDVWDSVLGIVEIFHVVLETFIMLLPHGLQGL